MAVTKTQKQCLLVITISIIAPMLAGFFLPQSTTTETAYETGQISTITNDLRNSETDYYGNYSGEMNNSQWGSYPGFNDNVHFIETTNQPNSTPLSSVTTETGGFTIDINGAPAAVDSIDTDESYFTDYCYQMIYTGSDSNKLSVADYRYGVPVYSSGHESVAYYPSAGKFYVDGEEQPSEYRRFVALSNSPSDTNYITHKHSTTEYAVLSSGVNVNQGMTATWQNGYVNSSVQIVASLEKTASFMLENITFLRDSSGLVTVSDLSGTARIGNYPQILISISEDNGITVSGLAAASLSTDPSSRIITTKTLSAFSISIPFSTLSVTSINTVSNDQDLLALYVCQAAVKMGSYKSTNDVTVKMADYYPELKGFSIRFNNGSTVGSNAKLTVCGHVFDVYSNGSVVYDGIEYNLTGTIISVVNNGVDFWAYINGVAIKDASQDSWSIVELSGNWGAIGVSIAEMQANSYDHFDWTAGMFALNQKEFAAIGLLAASLMFVIAAFIGRRSGEKMFWLLITSGCCAAVYLVLLM